MKKDRTAFWSFLIGLGSYTQVYVLGCIGISELVMFLFAPVLFWRDRLRLKKNGYMMLLGLLLLTMVGCGVSTLMNGHRLMWTMKIEAQFYAFFAVVVVFHHLFCKNADSLKWMLLGLFFSSVITIFVLHPELRADSSSVYVMNQSADEIVEGEMFWMGRLRSCMDVFASGFYFKTPLIVSLAFPVFYVIFLAKTTTTGRSASLMVLTGMALVFMGGKSRHKMKKLSTMFWLLIVLAFVMLALLKMAYKHAASTGLLGEAARDKYETQTTEGDSALKMLMSGRKEFFIGLIAAIDKPIIGHGVPSVDRKGYMERFLFKYGTQEECNALRRMQRRGFGISYIPSHSYIVGAWLRCGIMGLLLWGYVVLLCVNHVRKYLGAIPQWFGYFAFGVPTILWNVFFSPFNERITSPLLVCCLLFARAVAQQKVQLPFAMEMEARQHDK